MLNKLGALNDKQKDYAEAEAAYVRVLAIREKALGPKHFDVAKTLNDLADVYIAQSRYDEGESTYKRVITVMEGRPRVALALRKLARFYHTQGRYDDAEAIYVRILALYEGCASVLETLDELATLYDNQGRPTKASEMRDRSRALDPTPYCYRPNGNAMITVYLMECPPDTVPASRLEYEEWKASQEDYREKFRQRGAAELGLSRRGQTSNVRVGSASDSRLNALDFRLWVGSRHQMALV